MTLNSRAIGCTSPAPVVLREPAAPFGWGAGPIACRGSEQADRDRMTVQTPGLGSAIDDAAIPCHDPTVVHDDEAGGPRAVRLLDRWRRDDDEIPGLAHLDPVIGPAHDP